MGLGDTVYQLKKLVSLGLIDSAKSGKYRRLYPPNVEAYDRKVFSAILSPSRRRILVTLLACGESNLSAVANAVALSKSTVNWHFRILQSQGIVANAERGQYKLENPEKVANLIARFEQSTLDRLSEGFLESWELLDKPPIMID